MTWAVRRRKLLQLMSASAMLGGGGATSARPSREVVEVGDAVALARALGKAGPATTIVLADGIYESHEGFMLEAEGRVDAPIVVRAANRGRARLTGELVVRARAHAWLWGLNFQGAAAFLRLGGAHHRVVGCRFAEFGRADIFTQNTAIDLSSRTDALEIAYCSFERPAGFAPWRSVELDGQWPQWRFGIRGRHEPNRAPYALHVHHCHFRDFPAKPTSNYRSAQADAIEIAPIGSAFATANIIEYCLFENIKDDTAGSICDIKAGSDGIFQYNTATDCGGRVDIRSAEAWILRHNWLENTQGIAVYGRAHRLVDNRLLGWTGPIRLLRGNGDESFSGGGRQRVVDCLAQCNSGPLRVGIDWSSDALTHLPRDVQLQGHDGAIESHPDAHVQEQAWPCGPSRAFKLTASEVGPAAAPLLD